MGSPIVEINFAEEERRQFRCRSEEGDSIEEKSDSPPVRPLHPIDQKFSSPQKKTILDVGRVVYGELRKSLKLTGKDTGSDKKQSFSKTLMDVSGHFDELEAQEKAEQISPNTPVQARVRSVEKHVGTPPPVALKKPTMDSFEGSENAPLAKPSISQAEKAVAKEASRNLPVRTATAELGRQQSSSNPQNATAKPAELKRSVSAKPGTSFPAVSENFDEALTEPHQPRPRQVVLTKSTSVKTASIQQPVVQSTRPIVSKSTSMPVITETETRPENAPVASEKPVFQLRKKSVATTTTTAARPVVITNQAASVKSQSAQPLPQRQEIEESIPAIPAPVHSDDDSFESDKEFMPSFMSAIPATRGAEAASALHHDAQFHDESGEIVDPAFGSAKSLKWLASTLDNALFGKIPAISWSCAQVSEFLDACGLGIYARSFAENGVDGSTLLELTHDQIRRGLNVHERLHLLSLELGVEALKQRKVKIVQEWEWSCPKVSEWLEAKGLGTLVNKFKLGAVHGGVLFSLTEDQFVSELGVGKDSVLVLMSLLASIERAREVGPLKSGDDVPDWAPSNVRRWLDGLSLSHLVPTFKQFAVNGALLLHLDATIMRQEMNVTEIQAIVLEKAIVKLRKNPTKRKSWWSTLWKKVKKSVGSSIPRRSQEPSASNSTSTQSNQPDSAKKRRHHHPSTSHIAALYGKYQTSMGGHHNRKPLALTREAHSSYQTRPIEHHYQGGSNDRHNQNQTRPSRSGGLVSQQPVSPAPSRPPRPSGEASPHNARKTVSARPGLTRQNATVSKTNGHQNLADESSNLSIL